MIVYFDTSALVKTLLADEEGTALADELWRRASRKVASVLVYTEACAALAAARRADRIGTAALRVSAASLDAACSAMHLVSVDVALAQEAGALAQRHALRGYDAVHLATALAVNDPQLVLATWDRDLLRAAGDTGLTTASTLLP